MSVLWRLSYCFGEGCEGERLSELNFEDEQSLNFEKFLMDEIQQKFDISIDAIESN
jgi:hypothetical protein